MRNIEKQLLVLIECGFVKLRWRASESELVVTTNGIQAHHLLTHLLDEKQVELLNEKAFPKTNNIYLSE
jgi:hypothetical protein